MFSLLKNCQALFQSSYTILQSYQHCMGVSISLHSRQHLLASVFVLAIPVGVRWYLMDSISLATNDAEHLFMTLLAHWTNVYSNLLSILKLSVLNTHLLSAILFINIFPNSIGCLFTFWMMSFEAQEFFIVIKSNLLVSSLGDCALGS